MAKKKNPTADADVLKIIGKYKSIKPIRWVRTGVHSLDLILGGGIPIGRIIEIFGTEASGKTLIASIVAAKFQEMGGIVIFLDVESSADLSFMKTLGVNTEMVIAPELDGTIEDIRDQLVKIVNSLREAGFDGPILVIHDSIAQTTSINEFENFDELKPKEHSMGARAKAFSEFFRQYGKFFAANDITMLSLNQIREKIGVMFGKNYESPGGKALKFFASVRIEMNRGKRITNDDQVIGFECRASTEKNKCAPMGRKAVLRIMQSKGFDPYGGLEEVLIATGRVTKQKGSTSIFIGDKEYETAELAVKDHPDLLDNWQGIADGIKEEAVAGQV